MKRELVICILIAAMCVLLPACANQLPEPGGVAPTLNLREPEMTVMAGRYFTLELVQGGYGLAFTSSDESVATVDENGTVAALSEGTAIITAYMGGASASLTLTVLPEATMDITLDRNVYSLGETVTFTIEKSGSGTDQITIEAEFTETGLVIPVHGNSFIAENTGLVTITASSGSITARQQLAVFDLDELVQELFAITNDIRVEYGVNPLAMTDDALIEAAQVRAEEIAEYFSHTRPDGSAFATAFAEVGVASGNWGEILATGHRTPDEVLEGWLDSPSHREALLSDEYIYVGISLFMDGDGRMFWVQVFRGNCQGPVCQFRTALPCGRKKLPQATRTLRTENSLSLSLIGNPSINHRDSVFLIEDCTYNIAQSKMKCVYNN